MKSHSVVFATLSLSVACSDGSQRTTRDTASTVVQTAAREQPDSVADETDGCAKKLPPALSAQLQSLFPQHRVPLSSDNPAWAVRMDKRGGGDGCLGIAEGDFDGDGATDFAVLLSPSGDTTSPLIVARSQAQGYRIDTLRVWTGVRQALYVSKVGPSRQERTEILSDNSAALEPGEVVAFESKRPGVIGGVLESAAVVFFYDGKRWVHVWISD